MERKGREDEFPVTQWDMALLSLLPKEVSFLNFLQEK